MQFEQNFIDTVRDRASITEIIGKDVQLKKSGANYIGLCPFHPDKKPSMTVNEHKAIFKCFACGKGGNVFTYLMERKLLSFPDAVKTLAQQYGVPLPESLSRSDFYQRDRFLILKDINLAAAQIYQKYLINGVNAKTGRDYLRSRKISKTALEKFCIGFAPDDWHFIASCLQDKFRETDMITTGLLYKSNKTGKYFDFFRKRIIFPIHNERGEIVAFGGRSIDNQEPKYLNTGETPIFKKKNTLYGLYFVLNTFARQKEAFIVEGYFDVIACQLSGIPAVAPLGTALTEEHLIKLRKYAQRFVLVFDGDDAGRRAAVKTSRIIVSLAYDASVVLLPEKMDPYDILLIRGQEGLLRCVTDNRTDVYDFIINEITGSEPLSPAGKDSAAAALAELSLSIKSEVARDAFIAKAAQSIQISATQLKNKSAQVKAPYPAAPVLQKKSRSGIPGEEVDKKRIWMERNFVLLLCKNPAQINRAGTLLKETDIADKPSSYIYKKLLEVRHREKFSFSDVLELFPTESIRDFIISQTLKNPALDTDPERQIDDYLCKLKMDALSRCIDSVNAEIETMLQAEDRSTLSALQEKKLQLVTEKNNLKLYLSSGNV